MDRQKIRCLTRAAEMKPSERKNNEMGGSLQRYLTECCLTRMEGEGNERKFTLSFSSEEPYNRWWGTEILSHTDNAVDLDRLNSIGVVLYNHNRDKVIGKIRVPGSMAIEAMQRSNLIPIRRQRLSIRKYPAVP